MAWLRVQLTDEEQHVVNEERLSHPNERIRERMLVLWLLHNGVTRRKAAEIVGVGRATVQRFVAAFRDGGLNGLRQWDPNRPESEMAAFRELIREAFEKQPVRTVAEACDRIFQLTGLRRGPSQVRKFLKDLGLKFQRVRMVPVEVRPWDWTTLRPFLWYGELRRSLLEPLLLELGRGQVAQRRVNPLAIVHVVQEPAQLPVGIAEVLVF